MVMHFDPSASGGGGFHRFRREWLDVEFTPRLPGALAECPAAPPEPAPGRVSPHVSELVSAPVPTAVAAAASAWLHELPATPFGPPSAHRGEPAGASALADLPPPPPVAMTEPALAAPAVAARTASPLEIASLELTLADPLNRELIQAHGGALPAPSGGAPGSVLQEQVARYGPELTGRLTQLARANDAVRHLYLAAMDEAARGLGPGTMGAVFVPGSRGEGRGNQTPASWRFDPVAFTQAYARAGLQDGAPLAQRAFAALHGPDALQAWERHEGGDTDSTSRGLTLAGSFGLTPPAFTDIDGHPSRERMAWVPARLDASVSGLRPLSLHAAPELHQPQAVWFDASLGWVTPVENVVVKASFLDKAIPMVFAGVMTWATAGAFGIAGGAGVSAGTGLGAAGGVAGAMTAGAAFGAIGGFYGGLIGEGRIDLRGMLRGALTGAVTAGVTQASGLNGIGLNGAGQVTSYAQRALAVTGQATLQGALQEIAGGRFRDGFTAGLAQGLGAEVARGLNLKIAELQGSQAIDAAQAGALRQFARAAQSAVALLARPEDPGHAFALTFVNGLVGEVQGGLEARGMQGSGPWSDGGYRNGADIASDNVYATRLNLGGPGRDDAVREIRGAATLEDLQILERFPSVQRIDSDVIAVGPSSLTKADGTPVTYSFNQGTGRAYWNLDEGDTLREIPRAFQQPSLREAASLDPNNPFSNRPRLGNVLVDVGLFSAGGVAGLLTGGWAFGAMRAAGAGLPSAGATAGVVGDLVVQAGDNTAWLVTHGQHGRGGIDGTELVLSSGLGALPGLPGAVGRWADELRVLGLPDWNIRLTPAGAVYSNGIGVSLERVGGTDLFKNQLPDRLAAEFRAASAAGISPTRVGDPRFDQVLNQGTVKYVVTDGGDLLIAPHSVAQTEISHAVLSQGRPVWAAGQADVAGSANEYIGISISAHSGHYLSGATAEQSAMSLTRGREAFARLGIIFPD